MCTSNRINSQALALAVSVAAALSLGSSLPLAATAAAKKGASSHVEAINGSELKRVTLTQKAVDRLDIKTGVVAVDAAGIMTAPYAAVLYDMKGNTWVYTNPEPLAYVRHAVVVESIKGDRATLKQGPPAGTAVVVIGASELYGAENGVGH